MLQPSGDDYRATLNGVGWALCSLAVALTAARLYCRMGVLKRYGWDDYFMILATLSAIAATGLVSTAVHYGFGTHISSITSTRAQINARKYTSLAPAISLISACFSKISVVLFLLRLLGTAVKPVHKWVLYLSTTILILATIFCVIVLTGFCYPAQKAWDPTVPGRCMPAAVLDVGGRTVGVYSAVMDLVCAGFPVLMISTLNMKRRTKWGLAALMGGGVFAATATFVKVAMMSGITDTTDLTWSWSPIAVWYIAEMDVLIIAGCIPTLRPLWNVIRGRSQAGSSSGGVYNKNTGDQSDGIRLEQQSHTHRSKSSSAFAKPGPLTMAYREVTDDLDGLSERAGSNSSKENILPKGEGEMGVVAEERRRSVRDLGTDVGPVRQRSEDGRTRKFGSASNMLDAGRGSRQGHHSGGIQVQVTTDIDVREGTRDGNAQPASGGHEVNGKYFPYQNPFSS